MCTYSTEKVALNASAKGADGWFHATTASVYFDHPVHLSGAHALMVDVLNLSSGAQSRIGLELDAPSARALAEAILRLLDNVSETLRERDLKTLDTEGPTTLSSLEVH